ncbi:MAG TPA: hypothetical protein VFA70_02050 [Dehalococcoidia bacterium]|nr:hypothetical protein [Dehalococcoidia bacterium]
MSGTAIGALFALVLLPLLLNEAGEISPWLARRLLLWGARRLGRRDWSDRFAEEWLADLERVPGKLTKLVHACGVVLRSVPRMRWQAVAPRRARADQMIWDRLVARHAALVWTLVRAHGLRDEHAADVCQAVWQRYIELGYFSRWRPNRAAVVRLSALSLELTREYLAEVPGCADTRTPPTVKPTDELSRLWAALVSLSVSDRVLLGWHCRARPREIAAVLRVPLAEVKARRAEALSRLRLRLAQSDFEEPQEMQETIASAGSGAGAMAKSDHRR